jgi:hypothetical protein
MLVNNPPTRKQMFDRKKMWSVQKGSKCLTLLVLLIVNFGFALKDSAAPTAKAPEVKRDKAAGTVTFSFPAFSIGKLYYLEWIGEPVNFEYGDRSAAPFAVAQNNVTVPANSKIKLVLNSSSPKTIETLGNLGPQIISLDAHSVDKFDDEALKHLVWSKSIEQLNVADDDITDRGLKDITSNPSITDLKLARTDITGKGLPYLRNLPNLRRLSLIGTRIDDGALAQLLPLQKIKVLSVGKCHLSDKGVENIAKLKALSNLTLAGNTKVTNNSISLLQKLPVLYSLDLDQTSVDSRAIPDLAKMKKLQVLVVNFSDADLAKLKQVLPHCNSRAAGKRALTPEFFAPLK